MRRSRYFLGNPPEPDARVSVLPLILEVTGFCFVMIAVIAAVCNYLFNDSFDVINEAECAGLGFLCLIPMILLWLTGRSLMVRNP